MSADHTPEAGAPIVGTNDIAAHLKHPLDYRKFRDWPNVRLGAIAISGQPGFGKSGGALGPVS